MTDDFKRTFLLAARMPIYVPGALVFVGAITRLIPVLALGVGWILLKGVTGNLLGSETPDDINSTHWTYLIVTGVVILILLWLVTSRCTPENPCGFVE